MAHPYLHKVRAWSRSCDVAVNVYRASACVSDPGFAERMIRNAFSIPEAVAAAYGCTHPALQDIALGRGLEALVVLQTQLYLAAECGLLQVPDITALNHAADILAHELRREIEIAQAGVMVA